MLRIEKSVINITMIRTSDIVLDILKSDELALETLRAGLLNLSAYADKIHKQVENTNLKPVKRGTIVVSLSRIAQNLPKTSPLSPEIQITNLSFKSGLVALTYPKTLDLQRRISVLTPFQITLNELIALVEGISEVTLIVSEEARDKIVKQIGMKTNSEHVNLVAITARFPKELTDTPNVYYGLLSKLASKRIQVVEVISTDIEFTIVVKKEDLELSISAFNTYFTKK